MNLEDQIVQFIRVWGPDRVSRDEFVEMLRLLLEAYGRAALMHGNLPDTKHEHKNQPQPRP